MNIMSGTAEGMEVFKHTENLSVDDETEMWGKGVIKSLHQRA